MVLVKSSSLGLTFLVLTVDSGSSAVLVLLDLTAAFDAVVTFPCQRVIGLKGTVLSWFKSY